LINEDHKVSRIVAHQGLFIVDLDIIYLYSRPMREKWRKKRMRRLRRKRRQNRK
jgi:hypothetical protein